MDKKKLAAVIATVYREFVSLHGNFPADKIVCDPLLRGHFLFLVFAAGDDIPEYHALKALLSLRKAGLLPKTRVELKNEQ